MHALIIKCVKIVYCVLVSKKLIDNAIVLLVAVHCRHCVSCFCAFHCS